MDISEIEQYLTRRKIKVKEIIIETQYNQRLPMGGI